MTKTKNYILFKNHTEGIKLEKLLKNKNIKYVISPTPRQLSTCCGICIIYKKEDEEDIKQLIKDNNVDIDGFYTLEKKINNFYA